MKKEQGCFSSVLFLIVVLVLATVIVTTITGYDEQLDITEGIDSFSEFFAAMLILPVIYLILKFLGIIKPK